MDNIKISIIIPLLKKFKKDDSGAVLILVAVTLALVLVFVALALDVGYAWVKTRNMQAVADAAAYSGAAGIIARYKPPAALTSNMYADEIYGVAAASGFVSGSNGDTVTPLLTTAGRIAGNDCSSPNLCVTATITEIRKFDFISAIENIYSLTDKTGNLTYSAKGTALISQGIHYCMMALNPTQSGAFHTNGNVTIESPDCGLAVNSTATDAITTTGSSPTINTPVNVAGGWQSSGNPTLPAITYGNTVNNPYPLNTALMNELNSFPATNNGINKPPYIAGVSYSTLTTGKLGTYTLDPGIYYFHDIDLKGNESISGDGVTILISPNGTVSAGGAQNLNFTAPTTGPLQGIAIASLSNNNGGIQLKGGLSGSFSGAIYWPNGPLSLRGNVNIRCVQLVADTISLGGNVTINNMNDNVPPGSCIPLSDQIYPKTIHLIE